MPGYHSHISKDSRIRVSAIRDDIALRRNKDFFWPVGTQIYTGRQGSGKTISAVKHLYEIKYRYPKSIVVTNLSLTCLESRTVELTPEQSELLSTVPPHFLPLETSKYLQANLQAILDDFDPESQYIRFSTVEELSVVLTMVNNAFFGVVYLIDEIHTYFNSRDWQNVPMYVFTEISQQRKQRKCIIGTSQMFMRVDNLLREQANNLVICRTIFGAFTWQRCIDGETINEQTGTGQTKKIGWFVHTSKLRNLYDTYQKVVSGSEQYQRSITEMTVVQKKSRRK